MANERSPSMFAATDSHAVQYADALILVARLLIAWVFLTNGWGKVGSGMAGGTAYLTSLGVPAPGFWVWPAMIAELLIGITLILGIGTRYMALFTFVYLIIATALAHRYWQYPAAQQGAQYAHFCKNLAIMGGALLLYVTNAGRYSVDAKMRR